MTLHDRPIITPDQFDEDYLSTVARLLRTEPVNRGSAHAMADDTTASTHELNFVTKHIKVSRSLRPEEWALVTSPNLPWADDHFAERVSGEPLNPAPSEAWWPYARGGNAEHKKNEVFSHTYPERFWPVFANAGPASIRHSTRSVDGVPHVGIRFQYGDLDDVVSLLADNPKTRQAYLPVWFPEDLTAARHGERVPCSMGYHFMWCPSCSALDCVYSMRSCDVVRFYRDDVYMAGRLLQWVAERVDVAVGQLVVNIDNLHCFPGDRPHLESLLPRRELRGRDERRSGYDFGSMM